MRLFFFLLLLAGCQEKPTDKPQYPQEEVIARLSHQKKYTLETPVKAALPTYSWTKTTPPPITKHYFRCKGCSTNPPISHQEETLKDCGGWQRHSLPVKNKEEFIYPILIDLLNYIQSETGHKVIITSGHRCPKHNTYLDPTTANQYSKHMIGAEVSFYVEGMEKEPEKVIQLLQEYYKESEWPTFKRFEGKTNVSTLPWSNKEIFIKLFKSNEGRSCDNAHPYPYIAIQVRYDRDSKEAVTYTWARANRGFYQK